MAEPLKNHFGPEVAESIAADLAAIDGSFDVDRFLTLALDGFEDLELTPRARHIAEAMAACLPADRAEALRTLIDSLGPENPEQELTGMASFRYLPHVYFVADHGLEHFDLAMEAQYELTKRFTAEFSIRAYLEHHERRTLDVLERWAGDGNVHVRRLVSEGTRPRLPWAPRLRRFQEDPTPVLALLERLKDDPEEYVRRSVANNLNDISKDHPDVVIGLAARWWDEGDEHRRRLVRHGLRTLIKAGHPEALAVLGYGADSPVRVGEVRVDPAVASIGGKVRVRVVIENPSDRPGGALVDLIVHFVKASGATTPKVFKGAERTLAPGEHSTVSKSISLAQHSTRTHHPGTHRVEVQLNGVVQPGDEFQVTAG